MKQIHLSFRAWLVSLAALLAALPACADVTPDQLEFTEVAGGYSVQAKSGETLSGALVIPDTYGGKPVVEIGKGAFWNCSGLTSVRIPDRVTTIGEGAFEICSGLTSITIPDAVTTIGWWAFASCSGLTSIHIGDAVTIIGRHAFEDCSGLTSVHIGNGVTMIEGMAFWNCPNLTEITCSATTPPSLDTAIGITSTNSTFDNSLYAGSTVYVPQEAVEAYRQDKIWSHFQNIVSLDVKLGQLVLTKVEGGYSVKAKSGATLSGALVIPDTYNGQPVVEIGDSAFISCKDLTSVTIPDAVKTIEDRAFEGCSALTSVHIGDGVTTIGEGAFWGCFGLTNITIPDAVTTIGIGAFGCCSGLTSINIPDAVTTIGIWAFWNCDGLTSINIPDGVTTIGERTFESCSGLTSIHIPDGVTTIGERAFSGCSGLTSINIPNAVTTIGEGAFASCSGLTSVHIGNGVTTIGDVAFGGCKGLTSINIPDAVKTIGDRAFRSCSGLTEITCSATTPPNFGDNTFDDSHYAEAAVYVPQEAVETYRQDENWSRFQNIVGKNLTSVGRIEAANADDAASATTIYDLRGAKVAASPERLPQGTYIVRQGDKSKKINVK